MQVFVNSNETVTAVQGQTVYTLKVGSLRDAFAIVEVWLRGGDNKEFAAPYERTAAYAVKALILADCSVGHLSEMQSMDDPRLRMLNRSVNPTGQAGSSQWAICR